MGNQREGGGEIMVYHARCSACKAQHSGNSPFLSGWVCELCFLRGKETRGAAPSVGVKHDFSKPRYSLLPPKTLPLIVSCLEHGAKKYTPDNWMKVLDGEKGRERYYDAAMRHLQAWWEGEKDDSESGLPHLAHAICCLLFLLWGDRRGG